MFILLNKKKIITYFITIINVILLFAITIGLQNEVIQVSTNLAKRKVPIYNVDTKENKIALTMNCAWNADDVEQILQILEKNNIKITFFMVGDWIQKYPEAAKKISDAGHEIR